MKLVHNSLLGISGTTFRIVLNKNHFRSNFILGIELPPAYTAIYTPRFIKTINNFFLGVPYTDEELEELSKSHLAAALIKQMKDDNR